MFWRSTPSSPPSSSYFDNVPNEVLEHIICFIPLWEEVRCCRKYSGTYSTVRQAIALMQVSHRFRRVTQSSKFWREPDFYFEHLLPGPDRQSIYGDARCASLVRALFDDPYFKSCMRRKSDWSIRSFRMLRALRDCLPFSRIVRCVCIDVPAMSYDMVPILNQLSKCRNLTTLFVDSANATDLDLSFISTALPKIQHLNINLPSNLEGSLHGLTALESLGLWHRRCNFSVKRLIGNEVLPVGSAKTLARLDLRYLPLGDDFSLREFANVRHLIVNTFQDKPELNVLSDFPSKLTSFEAVIDLGSEFLYVELPEEWPRFLACPCFLSLRQMCLQVTLLIDIRKSSELVIKYIEKCMDILEKMSTQMILLEEIKFCGSMDLDRVYYVKRWKHLESLVWDIPTNYFLDAVRGLDMVDLTAIVLGQFEDFARKPRVVVKGKERYIGVAEGKEASEEAKFRFGAGSSWLS